MFRKFAAPFLFDGHTLHKNKVLITTDDGTVENIVVPANAGDDVESFDGCLCPGFINAHCHLELSHLKDRIPKHSGMVNFLEHVLFNRQAPEEIIMLAMHNACDEMTGKGIVAVADICNLDISAAVKASHALYWHNFIEVSGFVPDSAEKRFHQATSVASSFHQYFPSRQVTVSPHAPYSVSQQLMKLVCDQQPALFTMHNQESAAEQAFMKSASGNMLHLYESLGIDISFFSAQKEDVLSWWLPYVDELQRVILVHNCYTSAEDIRLISKSINEVFWCVCPKANLYIGNQLPAAQMMIEMGATLCIGTDSLASNNSLSMVDEMHTLQINSGLSASALLQMATLNGAKALDIHDVFGHFGRGAKPGILQLEGFDEAEDFAQVSVHRLL